MSGKGTFTSRERIAMIVVAGVVAIAIAALALQQRNSVPVVVEQPTAQVAKRTVHDSADSTKKTHKHTAKKSSKQRASTKVQKAKPKPKPRDYFTSPENE